MAGKTFVLYRVRWLSVALFVSLTGAAVAAEWSIDPSVSLRGEYNDNIRLTTLSHQAVWGTRLAPTLVFSRKTETGGVDAGASWSFRQYSGEIRDRNDQEYKLTAKTNWERNGLQLAASLKRESDVGTGNEGYTNQQHDVLTVAPSWTYILSELDSVKLGLSHSESDYRNKGNSNLSDYTYQSASVNWLRKLSELNQVTLSLSKTKYGSQNENSTSTSKTTSFLIGLDHRFSETLQGTISWGKRRTEMDGTSQACFYSFDPNPIQSEYCEYFNGFYGFHWENVPQHADSNGSTMAFSIEKKTDSGSISGSFSRDVSPSGYSMLRETDNLNLQLEEVFSHKFSGYAKFVAQRNKYVSATPTSYDTRSISIEPGLRWRLDEQWTLLAAYRYVRQKYDVAAQAAMARSVYFNLTYDWPKMAVSR